MKKFAAIFVVEALLSRAVRRHCGTLKPRLILMEINEKIPPQIQFTVNQNAAWGWRGDHCFGASIEKIALVVRPLGYVPVALDWNNLYILPRHAGDESLVDTSTASLYALGYAQREGRAASFPWNQDVESLWTCDSHSPPWRRFAGFSCT